MKCFSALFQLLIAGGALTIGSIQSATSQTAVSPQNMRVVGEVDTRFVSYNVEAVEVTGGRFWAPYKSSAEKSATGSDTHSGNQPGGLDSSLFHVGLRCHDISLGIVRLRVIRTVVNLE